MTIISSERKGRAAVSSVGKDVGLIFNIQRFSIQDGPGIRSTVFMKGCPLRCWWCSNPESQKSYPEIMILDRKCSGCGKCIEICPKKAITMGEEEIAVNQVECDLCLKCAEVCAWDAIQKVGDYMEVDEVVAEVEKDRLFYFNSGGGVTVSGGEPLAQWEFTASFLNACKEKGLHTALDTCGYAPWNVMEQVLEWVDLALFDIKHMDAAKHEEATGVDNALILDNARKTAYKVDTWLRIPLIPGFNNSETNLREVAKFASRLPFKKISLLPYHEYGVPKYHSLRQAYPLEGTSKFSDEEIDKAKKILESSGLPVDIGR